MSRRVWRLKQNYTSRPAARDSGQRKTLLEMARRVVAGRTYFRQDHAHDSTEINPTSQT